MATVDKFKLQNTDDLISRKTYSISSFAGVDYSSAQLGVADNHATDILNFVYRDNVNQKRKGWEQVAQIGVVKYRVYGGTVDKSNTLNVNGVWKFIGEDKQEYIIAHIGHLLYSLVGFGQDKTFLDSRWTPLLYHSGNYWYALELNDSKSSAFFGNNRIYILDGNKYLYLRIGVNKTNTLTATKIIGSNFEYGYLEDSEYTYIPTTTIGVTYTDSPVSGATALDDVNLLTKWRKNKMVSGTWVENGTDLRTTYYWEYPLDTSVRVKNNDEQDLIDMEIKISYIKESEA